MFLYVYIGICFVCIEFFGILPALIQTITNIGFSFAHVYMILYAVSADIPNPGLYFTFSSVAAVVTRIIGGRLADRNNVLPCLVAGYAFGIISYALLSATTIPVAFYLCGALWGVSQGLVNPITNRLAVLGVDPSRRGAASATYSISADLGNGLGGIIWGVMIDRFSYITCFRCISGWLFVSFLIATVYLSSRKKGMCDSLSRE